jgi:hypothetical protein
MVVPILTYGSEVWITEFKPNFEALDKTQFEKTQNMILKNILGITLFVQEFSLTVNSLSTSYAALSKDRGPPNSSSI